MVHSVITMFDWAYLHSVEHHSNIDHHPNVLNAKGRKTPYMRGTWVLIALVLLALYSLYPHRHIAQNRDAAAAHDRHAGEGADKVARLQSIVQMLQGHEQELADLVAKADAVLLAAESMSSTRAEQALSLAEAGQSSLGSNYTKHVIKRLAPWPGQAGDVFSKLPLSKTDTERRGAVKAAMLHAWRGYEQYAWGTDELMPVSKKGKNSFGQLGATIVDALDTLWLMELTDEYNKAREWIHKDLRFDVTYDASVFETTIRVAGGMLAAYDLTGDEMYVHRTAELVDRLLPAFETPTGIPYNTINLQTLHARNPSWARHASTLSEFGTEQLEYIKLSAITNLPVYADKAETSIRYLHDQHPDLALFPCFINPHTGEFTKQQISLGALGDSAYEYLLKVWILRGRQDEMYRSMWEAAMDAMLQKLVQYSDPSGYAYIAEMLRTRIRKKMDHLACFVPGMLALGVHAGAVTGDKARQYMAVAVNVTYTCYMMYNSTVTGLSPEYVNFVHGHDMVPGVRTYLQRPEVLESFFLLNRFTGDDKYKEWGWNIFEALQKHCKVEAGYSGIKDVRRVPVQHDDVQQSFLLAETFKYLYLLFSPRDMLDLDKWVLNTEAHPLRIMPFASNGRR